MFTNWIRIYAFAFLFDVFYVITHDFLAHYQYRIASGALFHAMSFLSFFLYNKVPRSINIMMPIVLGAKYFDMVHRHYTEVLIHLEDGIEADQATAFRQLTWIGVVYMFYCFFLTSDWFWH
jgi:hypothetical protein